MSQIEVKKIIKALNASDGAGVKLKRSIGTSFHEKSEKNSQTNQGGSYKRIIKLKYKKARTKGDKNFNQRNKQKGKKPF